MANIKPISKKFLTQYLETALWAENDESDERGGEPFDKNYSISDFSDEALEKATRDTNKFIEENEADLAEISDEDAGHDFWLTRNRHGAGFGDGDYPKDIDNRLRKAAQAFGEINIYVGDDGELHFT